jgi:hypothetical protein
LEDEKVTKEMDEMELVTFTSAEDDDVQFVT